MPWRQVSQNKNTDYIYRTFILMFSLILPASEVAFNFQTELPSNAQVCLQSKVDWVSTE